MTKPTGYNSSVLGRLLEELSWAGPTIRDYRNGGRGYENVLTAEALLGLDFLPRKSFLGAVIKRADGASAARERLISEVEEARLTLLPGSQYLIPGENGREGQLAVQPDGFIESQSAYVVVEAKRIRSSSFQPEQLAREYVLALRDSGTRVPILLLILGAAPPVKVAKHGALQIHDAISLYLSSVLSRAKQHQLTEDHALSRLKEVVCWITWSDIAAVVAEQLASTTFGDPSIHQAVTRLAQSVTKAISWHGPEC